MLQESSLIPMIPVALPQHTNQPLLDKNLRDQLIADISEILLEKNAVVIAHYYTHPDLQELADKTQGFVGDSLAMANFGYHHKASTLMIAGVKFMGETAKILSPEKCVIMPTLKATCSLDLGCPTDEFIQFCDQHPKRTVVVYANTSAAVKARADWVVTSSNAIDIVEYLDANGEKIIWAPDKHLGQYIQKKTGADMILWNGSCVVHEEFKTAALIQLKQQYPDAIVLVHPESPESVVDLADVVGSTTRLLKASQDLPNKRFIVATDRGIFYKMQQASPEKIFIEAPTGGEGATCRSCAHCPWMAMNTLVSLKEGLLNNNHEILVDADIIQLARRPLERMIHFSQ